MESYLETFCVRLSETKETIFDPFAKVLAKVAASIRAELELPQYPAVLKAGDGRIQIHWPPLDPGFNISEVYEAFNQIHKDTSLVEFLEIHADDTVAHLITVAKEQQLTCFYQLELPSGCGALWNPPVRLVWDYCISIDSMIARYDIIGATRKPQNAASHN